MIFYLIKFIFVVGPPQMKIIIGVPKEVIPGEKRVALVPNMVASLVKLGFEVRIEKTAGSESFFSPEQYQKAGAILEDSNTAIYQNCSIILKVQIPQKSEISEIQKNTILISFAFPHCNPEEFEMIKSKPITFFAMEKIPRVTRAQSMDALSSQATITGYKAALYAAQLSPRFFPMLTTAAGTIRPAKVLVMGVGVAGLQAIATAKRIGALVEGYDVRSSAREQVESLGARFISSAINAETQGGYARELSSEEKAQDAAKLAEHVALADVVITTAQIPGKQAPLLINREMVLKMKPGSVIIDLAAESGGNCEFTEKGKLIEKNQIKIFGPVNLPSELPVHASETYAKNIFNFFDLLTQGGKSTTPNFKDEIIAGTLLFSNGSNFVGPQS